ncbi:MAG: sigma-54-dependent Fis family transcriptional regulator [Gammaproteobacteria bacterium]|nr:sigma-54-dependent Fis family transcriptional regulator [Gammaproteobacteria bacterium]
MKKPLALIVDDEPDIRELLEITLTRMGVDTCSASDLKQAHDYLNQQTFDLCLTDMRLPDGNGIDLVRKIGTEYPQLPVAMITAHGNMESAIEALKAGAFDFVSKPVDLKMLRRLVETALRLNSKQQTADDQEDNAHPAATILLGKSAAIESIRNMTIKLARNQAPVYISGESGTGKELAARLIHQQGPRSKQAFVAVNCGAIPQELMESEFFGHKKGSFTGAVTDKDGLFQAADGGTLFLDEVADLPLPMQVKLLRAIQEKSVRPIGGHEEIQVDVRIISATHQDLAQMVEEKEFRQDLFYRINVIELHIPPLRERQEDIPLLVKSILTRLAEENATSEPKIGRNALKKLYSHPFPGNVRQLENTLERALTMCDDGAIGLEHLNLPEPPPMQLEMGENQPLEEYMEQIERQAITRALEETRWNRTAAAKKLGLSFRALRYRLSKLGIE